MSCRLIIAYDAPDVRNLLRSVLEEAGFSIVADARNGAEAVEMAGREEFDVMLLDLSMPVMDGLEALPLVVEAAPDSAVVVLSGFVNQDVRQKVAALGAADCVEKGMNLPVLIQTVRDVCAGEDGHPHGDAARDAARDAVGSPPLVVAPAPAVPAGHSVLEADDLVPVVMHELNPPVQILRRALDVATRAHEVGDASVVADQLDTAQRALEGVTSVLGAFSEMRAADAGQLQVQPEPVDLSEVVRQVVADLESVTVDHVVETVADGEVVALADTGRVRQVLANLVSNAVKFSPPGTLIEVGVGANGTHCFVWVRDHGKGVPPEAADAIFAKYAQLGDGPGMGLGLYIARAIARAHGGELVLEIPDDGGTRFVATLRLA